jgi:hypothetical protein
MKTWSEAMAMFFERFNRGQDTRRGPRKKWSEFVQTSGMTHTLFWAELATRAANASVDTSMWVVMEEIREKKLLPAWRMFLSLYDPKFLDYTFDELWARCKLLDDSKVDIQRWVQSMAPIPQQQQGRRDKNTKPDVPSYSSPSSASSSSPSSLKCSYPGCGGSHRFRNCPIRLALVCTGCGHKGHLLADCRITNGSTTQKTSTNPRQREGKESKEGRERDLSHIKCHKCGKKGHYAMNCKSTTPAPSSTPAAPTPDTRSFQLQQQEKVELLEANQAIRGDDGGYIFRCFNLIAGHDGDDSDSMPGLSEDVSSSDDDSDSMPELMSSSGSDSDSDSMPGLSEDVSSSDDDSDSMPELMSSSGSDSDHDSMPELQDADTSSTEDESTTDDDQPSRRESLPRVRRLWNRPRPAFVRSGLGEELPAVNAHKFDDDSDSDDESGYASSDGDVCPGFECRAIRAPGGDQVRSAPAKDSFQDGYGTHISAPCLFNGTPAGLLVDSGANARILLVTRVAAERCSLLVRPLNDGDPTSLSLLENGRPIAVVGKTSIDKLEFGNRTLHDVQCLVADSTSAFAPNDGVISLPLFPVFGLGISGVPVNYPVKDVPADEAHLDHDPAHYERARWQDKHRIPEPQRQALLQALEPLLAANASCHQTWNLLQSPLVRGSRRDWRCAPSVRAAVQTDGVHLGPHRRSGQRVGGGRYH